MMNVRLCFGPTHLLDLSILLFFITVLVCRVESLASGRNRRVPSAGHSRNVPIVACSSAIELDRAMSHYVQTGDSVWGLVGKATPKIECDVGRVQWVSLASDEKEGSSGRMKNELQKALEGQSSHDVQHTELLHLDEWRSVFRSQVDINWDVLVVDLGAMTGNDLYLSSLALSNELSAMTELCERFPRVVLVKSKRLSRLAQRLIHVQRLLDGTLDSAVPFEPDVAERSPQPPIIACVGVTEYRRTMPFILRSNEDAVLEVGSHYGRTTKLLHDEGRYCIGVDIGPKIIQRARAHYPSVPFVVGDAWNTMDLLNHQQDYERKLSSSGDEPRAPLGYDVVYADIGGLSGPDGYLESLALLDSIGQSLQPRCIVIKSLCMRRLASRLVPFWRVWKNIRSSADVPLGD